MSPVHTLTSHFWFSHILTSSSYRCLDLANGIFPSDISNTLCYLRLIFGTMICLDCDASHSSILSVSSSSSFSVSLLRPDILLSICSRHYQSSKAWRQWLQRQNNIARNVAKNLRTSGECKPNVFIWKAKARIDIWQPHLEERLKS